jgi:tetratricopeptide (TPR) repeat protein
MAIRIGSLAVILLLTSALAWNQELAVGTTNQSQRLPEPSISTVRLRVPRKARRLYEKAIRPFREHRYDEAQRHLDQALHLCPAFPEALTLLGYIQLDLHQWEAAERSVQAAIRSDPTYGVAYLILSHLYNMQKRFDDAVEMSQRARTLMPDDWMGAYEMCTSFIKTEQYSMALSLGDSALRTTHGTMLHVAKAHALIGLKRYSEAVAELRTYLSDEPAGEGSQDARNLLDRIQTAANQGTR